MAPASGRPSPRQASSSQADSAASTRSKYSLDRGSARLPRSGASSPHRLARRPSVLPGRPRCRERVHRPAPALIPADLLAEPPAQAALGSGSAICTWERTVPPASVGRSPIRSRMNTLTSPVSDQSTSPGSRGRGRRPRPTATSRPDIRRERSRRPSRSLRSRGRSPGRRGPVLTDGERMGRALRGQELRRAEELGGIRGRGTPILDQAGRAQSSGASGRSSRKPPQSSTSISSSPWRTWLRSTPSCFQPL